MQWPERNKKLTFAGFNGSIVRQMQADMAELADALDLGSSGRPCRFDSCYPHKEAISTENTVFVASFLFRKMDRRTRNVHQREKRISIDFSGVSIYYKIRQLFNNQTMRDSLCMQMKM